LSVKSGSYNFCPQGKKGKILSIGYPQEKDNELRMKIYVTETHLVLIKDEKGGYKRGIESINSLI
jgi:hypothetical protein